jgi:lincosamide nucleotidyltransferase A/C/D/E
VDGGWAVDALLGKQTRDHCDLDIALPHWDVQLLGGILANIGFREQTRQDSWECNFVLVDAAGREIDVYSYALDDAGINIYGVQYIREQLAGTGTISSRPVRCISPE